MKKKHDILDLEKLVLSLLVAAVHIQPILDGFEIILPVCRLAVPTFFIISGYFFFSGYTRAEGDPIRQRELLRHYILRILRLYFAWEVLLLPVTIAYWRWYKYSLGKTLLLFLFNIPFGGTFFASWYLMAMVVGVCLVISIDRKFGRRALFVISLLLYMVCVATSTYGKLLGFSVPPSGYFDPKNSFPAAMIWLTVSREIAENRPPIQAFYRLSKGKKAAVFFAVLGVFILESALFTLGDWSITTDCEFSLVPLCTVIFLLLLQVDVHIPHARAMRVISTVMYCMHGSFGVVMRSVGRRIGIYFENEQQCAYGYLLTVFCCVTAGILIYKLKDRKGFHWLGWFC